MSQPSLDLDLGDEGMPTFSVRELAEAINGALRRSFFEGVWVRGEVQGLVERNGHVYFSLSDDSEEGPATLAVSLFANVRYRLRPLLQRHRIRLADGLRVRIHGYLDFYPPNGRLTLKMSGIDPRYTLGEPRCSGASSYAGSSPRGCTTRSPPAATARAAPDRPGHEHR